MPVAPYQPVKLKGISPLSNRCGHAALARPVHALFHASLPFCEDNNMSTVLHRPALRPGSLAGSLLTTMVAVRLSMTWFRTRQPLTGEEKREVTEPFGLEAKRISIGRHLLDSRHPAFRAVTAVRDKVIAYWTSQSLPYPEPGMRLIRQDKIDEFTAKMREFQEELAGAVQALDRNYHELRDTARKQLGNSYNSSDYPESLDGLFAISFDLPFPDELVHVIAVGGRGRFVALLDGEYEALAEELAKGSLHASAS